MSDLRVISKNELTFNGKTYRCAIGAGGFISAALKKEGDKATPEGSFALRECWYRSDRLAPPATPLALRRINADDGWCDDPAHECYNRHVKLPFAASHERLSLEENVYDIVVPLGYNDDPVAPGRGSAIFFHLARPNYAPTAGCVAVARADMEEILKEVTKESRMIVAPL